MTIERAPVVTEAAPTMTQKTPEEQAPQRKKYVFKKRDPVAAAQLEAQRVANMKQNPFGTAKPREAVLAERTGKDEATVLKEDANTYDIHLKLTSAQFAEKKAKQHEIDDLKASLASGDGNQDTEKLQADITKKESELTELVKQFEALLVEQAKAGQGARVDRTKPFESDRQESNDESYSNFSRGPKEAGQPMRGNRGSFQPGAYEDTADRDNRRDGFGGVGSRDGGIMRRRGGRVGPGGPGGRRDNSGFGDGFQAHAYHGKGQSRMQSAPGSDGHAHGGNDYHGHVQDRYHAAMPYPMPAVGGYNYAAPPMFLGYTMPASKSDYQPLNER